ncbi:deoxyribonuclease-1-like 2 isoform X1 [Excalfactoria chinensis]|uniref:deoxyribonuclease-1-like 2 isoform X1 n=2 Tax=Excalfactoria chinensis TaxID=46218 RepID=UPI003B3BE884
MGRNAPRQNELRLPLALVAAFLLAWYTPGHSSWEGTKWIFFTLSSYVKPISKPRIKPGSCCCILWLRIPPGRMGTVVLALSLLSMALLCPATATLRIGAFNIQSFGDSKMSDESVAGVIVNILLRYDVVLVQEVRDSDLSAVTELLERLNSVSSSPYDYEISGPLGRDNYKEMYLFLYRTDVVSVVDTYQYEDPQDVFSREPFVLRVSAPHSKAEEFVMVPLHSAPHDAVAEIDALYDVYLAVVNKWGTDNIVFLGDFNADCSYVKQSDWASIRLRSSDVFKWLIPDSADTTVGKSDCAYDRIVVCGSKLKRSIVPNSATVYNFQRAFQLEQEEALAVSDHYPVEVKLMA